MTTPTPNAAFQPLPSGPQFDKPAEPVRVKVCEFDMTFGKLVMFMVKVAFASIPAMFIVAFTYTFAMALIAAMMLR
jgi:hypothetical protein